MKVSTIFASIAACGLVSALPNPNPEGNDSQIEARASTCLPNFQGTNMYIASTAKNSRWTVKSLKDGSVINSAKGAKDTWRIEQTGQPQNDFIIKAGRVSDNGLLVKPFKASNLALASVQGAGNPSYTIACDYCMDPGQYPASGNVLAKGCTIIDSSTGLYVTEGAPGGALLRKPKGKAAGQMWTMTAA